MENWERKGFTFFRSFYDQICLLPKEKQLEAYRAIVNYGLNGIEYSGNDTEIALMMCIDQHVLLTGYKRYLAGRSGGAPKGNQNALKEREEERELEREREKKRKEGDSLFLVDYGNSKNKQIQPNSNKNNQIQANNGLPKVTESNLRSPNADDPDLEDWEKNLIIDELGIIHARP